MLSSIIRLLIEEYGQNVVVQEVNEQTLVCNVDSMAALLRKSGESTLHGLKIRRIKVVWKMRAVGGLKESKEWVEAHFTNNGDGPPL